MRGYKGAETRGQLFGKGIKGRTGIDEKGKLCELNERYRMKRKELKTTIEELKQRMLAKGAKVG